MKITYKQITSSNTANNEDSNEATSNKEALEELMVYDSTFRDNLNESERTRLNTMTTSRTNPLSKLKRDATKKVLQDIQEIAENKESLPVLEAWLEKKSTSMGNGYQKRWVIVRGSHLLWSDIQRDTDNPKSATERKKFNNSVNLMAIKDIQLVTKGKTQRKFMLIIGTSGIKNTRKEY